MDQMLNIMLLILVILGNVLSWWSRYILIKNGYKAGFFVSSYYKNISMLLELAQNTTDKNLKRKHWLLGYSLRIIIVLFVCGGILFIVNAIKKK